MSPERALAVVEEQYSSFLQQDQDTQSPQNTEPVQLSYLLSRMNRTWDVVVVILNADDAGDGKYDSGVAHELTAGSII